MVTNAAMLERIDSLTSAVLFMAKVHGARLSRADMCDRLGCCSKTLTERVRSRKVPAPGADGKWLLSEIVEWEAIG